MNKKRKRVVVAMSGGVDSSVAAALLVEQGYEVIGMMMRLWSEPGSDHFNRCCTPESMALAKRVASKLNVPFYAIDAKEPFRDIVVRSFIDGYKNGITPNPCLVCNHSIRWGFFLKRALMIEADYMATGHYARLEKSDKDQIQLLRAVDQKKDQSYVLHMLNQYQLKHTLLPLGIYTKGEVRQIARNYDLPVAERPESQDLCFLGDEDYRDFLARKSPEVISPGYIYSTEGEQIGQHRGLAFYTIGQRKGLELNASIPMYVVKKDIQHNTLIVGSREKLGRSEFFADSVNWLSGQPPENTFLAQVKIRYRAQAVSCKVKIFSEKRVFVNLFQHLPDITPGQAAVFYNNEVCLGGGIIQS